MRNAMAVLMCSRGTPMFFMGDEFGNSQGGNNNAYCQDNYISWLDWDNLVKHRLFFDFVKAVIALRKEHVVLRRRCAKSSLGFPKISTHDVTPWRQGFADDSHYVGVMFAGRKPGEIGDDVVYLGVNTWWEEVQVTLPELPIQCALEWVRVLDTMKDYPEAFEKTRITGSITIGPRSVQVVCALPFGS